MGAEKLRLRSEKKVYLGVRVVTAQEVETCVSGIQGYLVETANGGIGFVPKEVFERDHRLMDLSELKVIDKVVTDKAFQDIMNSMEHREGGQDGLIEEDGIS